VGGWVGGECLWLSAGRASVSCVVVRLEEKSKCCPLIVLWQQLLFLKGVSCLLPGAVVRHAYAGVWSTQPVKSVTSVLYSDKCSLSLPLASAGCRCLCRRQQGHIWEGLCRAAWGQHLTAVTGHLSPPVSGSRCKCRFSTPTITAYLLHTTCLTIIIT
jgi:hypothetical protein